MSIIKDAPKQADAIAATIERLRWHLQRKPDLSLAEISILLSVSMSTAQRLRRRLAKDVAK